MVIDHQNVSILNNRMPSRWLLTIETHQIHYQNAHFTSKYVGFALYS